MPPVSFSALENAVAATGLLVRGGFHPGPDDRVPGPAATLVMIGNAGPALWRAFAGARKTESDPLDTWTRGTVSALAETFGAGALFPFEGPPYRPFPTWAQRCEPVHPSPLGALIHPTYGLWHAYRAALLFAEHIELPERDAAPSPCATCADKPCLHTCPVGAFAVDSDNVPSYDVPACAAFVASDEGRDCSGFGCAARRACPVGRDYVYEPAQAAFHMSAFTAAHRPRN